MESFRISAEGGGYDRWFELTPKGRKDLRYPPKERLKILFPTLATVNRVGRQVSVLIFGLACIYGVRTKEVKTCVE